MVQIFLKKTCKQTTGLLFFYKLNKILKISYNHQQSTLLQPITYNQGVRILPQDTLTVYDFLDRKRVYFIPLSMSDDREALIRRAWKAKSGGKANEDFLKNPPLKSDGQPIGTLRIKKQFAYLAQFIVSVKTKFGAQAINDLLEFVEEVRKEEIEKRKLINRRRKT